MDDCAQRHPPPQLFCAPNLRCAEVSDRLVLLDLAAGTYDVTDEVGAAMWTQLLLAPGDRDLEGLATAYAVPSSVLESDLSDFASAQLASGRMATEIPAETCSATAHIPRRKPSILRAWRERASVGRDLKRSFAAAYATRTGPHADTAPPRIGTETIIERFRAAEGLYPSRDAPQDCLPRSLALTRFLRGAGWQAQHVIGVALYPFEAHAWVELDGVPLNEGGTFLQRFTVIQRA